MSWIPESCTANFASKTKRLHEPPPIVTVRQLTFSSIIGNLSLQDIPPPGSYEVQKSYSKTQGNLYCYYTIIVLLIMNYQEN